MKGNFWKALILICLIIVGLLATINGYRLTLELKAKNSEVATLEAKCQTQESTIDTLKLQNELIVDDNVELTSEIKKNGCIY